MNIAEKLKNAKPQTPPENFGDIDPEKNATPKIQDIARDLYIG